MGIVEVWARGRSSLLAARFPNRRAGVVDPRMGPGRSGGAASGAGACGFAFGSVDVGGEVDPFGLETFAGRVLIHDWLQADAGGGVGRVSSGGELAWLADRLELSAVAVRHLEVAGGAGDG